jgi:hypothetical protein
VATALATDVRAGAFRVLDPGFSAILARGAADLAWLAGRLGEARIAEESRTASERVIAALRARTDSDGLIRPVDTIGASPVGPGGRGRRDARVLRARVRPRPRGARIAWTAALYLRLNGQAPVSTRRTG